MACTKVGSPNYISPEIWAGRGYSYKCDLWSLGVLIFELCEFRSPFEPKYLFEIQRGDARQRNLTLSKKYSQSLENLVNNLLKINHSERLDAEDVKKVCILRS